MRSGRNPRRQRPETTCPPAGRRSWRATTLFSAFVAVALFAGGATVHAQLPPVPPSMAALDFMVGEWEGSGWIEYAPGQRGEFSGRERVERRMGGRVLLVEGDFTSWMGPQQGHVPVHQALGVLSWDPAAAGFTFRAYTAQQSDAGAWRATVDGRRLVWGYEDPSFGVVRFTIEVDDDGTWHEHGVVSADGGETWRRFFEMTLRPR
jgi:hypothetical protein